MKEPDRGLPLKLCTQRRTVSLYAVLFCAKKLKKSIIFLEKLLDFFMNYVII